MATPKGKYSASTPEEKEKFMRRLEKAVKKNLRISGINRVMDTVSKPYPGQSGFAFGKTYRDLYTQSIMGGPAQRTHRLKEYDLMDATSPLCSVALDIYASNSTRFDTSNDNHVLKIFSENEQIKEELEELFYVNLNVDMNLRNWIRAMCKYGDHFLLLDIDEEHGNGVVNAIEMPPLEMERLEVYDPQDRRLAVQFVWNMVSGTAYMTGFRSQTTGNSLKELSFMEVAHLRILSDATYSPYGRAILEPARIWWRNLKMAEDAMLCYRLTRAAERRVFKLEVGNLAQDKVEQYIQSAMAKIKTQNVIDQETGDINLAYNVWNQMEDYVLPQHGGVSSSIETLPGATNLNDIEDVEYIQKILLIALRIPKPYVTYDEALQTKATLAQENAQFAATIERIQQYAVSELRKIAVVHLAAKGHYDEDDIRNFDIALTSPSSSDEEARLELVTKKYDIYRTSQDAAIISPTTAKRVILKMSDMEIQEDIVQQIEDGKVKFALKKLSEEGVPYEITLAQMEQKLLPTTQGGANTEKKEEQVPSPTAMPAEAGIGGAPSPGGEAGGATPEIGGGEAGSPAPEGGGTQTASIDPFARSFSVPDKLFNGIKKKTARRSFVDNVIETSEKIAARFSEEDIARAIESVQKKSHK